MVVVMLGFDFVVCFDFVLDFIDDVNGIELVVVYVIDCIDVDIVCVWFDSYVVFVGVVVYVL